MRGKAARTQSSHKLRGASVAFDWSCVRVARYQPTEQRSQRGPQTHPITPKRQMDNIMYLYEQPGPPDDAPKATAAAEDGGLGGLNWVALERHALYTSRAKRASSPCGTSNATLLGEGLRRPLLEASLRVGDLRGSSAEGFPIRSQNNKARQSASDARAFKDCASAISLAPTKS